MAEACLSTPSNISMLQTYIILGKIVRFHGNKLLVVRNCLGMFEIINNGNVAKIIKNFQNDI